MKLICPGCHYTSMVDAGAASASSADQALSCARCGAALNQLPWNGAQPSTLTTATVAAANTVAPQRMMENQNAYAPSADTGFEDVLEIPSPLRSAEPTAEQMLVLEDVIPAEDFSTPDEIIEPQMEGTDSGEDTLLSTQAGGYLLPAESAALAGEKSPLAGPGVYGAQQTSSFDYDGGRAWLRAAPLLLLLGTLVFFALYFLGNRVGSWSSKPQEVAATPAQPPTQSADTAAAPEKAESTTQAAQPSGSSVVAAKAETPAPVAQPLAETAPRESKPAESKPAVVAATVTAPAPVVSAPTAPVVVPVANQSAGNFTVQVGSYNVAAQADERAGQLRSNGVEARVVRADIPRRGTWYRVQAGRFASQAEAARYGAELKGKGATDSFIITELQGQ
jgi:cell division protein FtsN